MAHSKSIARRESINITQPTSVIFQEVPDLNLTKVSIDKTFQTEPEKNSVQKEQLY